jgi:hypothetical protein
MHSVDMSENAYISSFRFIAQSPSTSYQSKVTQREKHHEHSQLLLPTLLTTKPKHALDHSTESTCVDFESEQSSIYIERSAREIWW